MRWETWLFFIITDGVMSLTPGPAVLESSPLRPQLEIVCGTLLFHLVEFGSSANNSASVMDAPLPPVREAVMRLVMVPLSVTRKSTCGTITPVAVGVPPVQVSTISPTKSL